MSAAVTWHTAIIRLPGTDGCIVETPKPSPRDTDTQAGDTPELGFRGGFEGGVRFRLRFTDNGKTIFTSEEYFKPDGVTLTEYASLLRERDFPDDYWPTEPSGKPLHRYADPI